jgi:hypothetical protein
MFVLHIDNANTNAVRITPGEKQSSRCSHDNLLDHLESLERKSWQSEFPVPPLTVTKHRFRISPASGGDTQYYRARRTFPIIEILHPTAEIESFRRLPNLAA